MKQLIRVFLLLAFSFCGPQKNSKRKQPRPSPVGPGQEETRTEQEQVDPPPVVARNSQEDTGDNNLPHIPKADQEISREMRIPPVDQERVKEIVEEQMRRQPSPSERLPVPAPTIDDSLVEPPPFLGPFDPSIDLSKNPFKKAPKVDPPPIVDPSTVVRAEEHPFPHIERPVVEKDFHKPVAPVQPALRPEVPLMPNTTEDYALPIELPEWNEPPVILDPFDFKPSIDLGKNPFRKRPKVDPPPIVDPMDVIEARRDSDEDSEELLSQWRRFVEPERSAQRVIYPRHRSEMIPERVDISLNPALLEPLPMPEFDSPDEANEGTGFLGFDLTEPSFKLSDSLMSVEEAQRRQQALADKISAYRNLNISKESKYDSLPDSSAIIEEIAPSVPGLSLKKEIKITEMPEQERSFLETVRERNFQSKEDILDHYGSPQNCSAERVEATCSFMDQKNSPWCYAFTAGREIDLLIGAKNESEKISRLYLASLSGDDGYFNIFTAKSTLGTLLNLHAAGHYYTEDQLPFDEKLHENLEFFFGLFYMHYGRPSAGILNPVDDYYTVQGQHYTVKVSQAQMIAIYEKSLNPLQFLELAKKEFVFELDDFIDVDSLEKIKLPKFRVSRWSRRILKNKEGHFPEFRRKGIESLGLVLEALARGKRVSLSVCGNSINRRLGLKNSSDDQCGRHAVSVRNLYWDEETGQCSLDLENSWSTTMGSEGAGKTISLATLYHIWMDSAVLREEEMKNNMRIYDFHFLEEGNSELPGHMMAGLENNSFFYGDVVFQNSSFLFHGSGERFTHLEANQLHEKGQFFKGKFVSGPWTLLLNSSGIKEEHQKVFFPGEGSNYTTRNYLITRVDANGNIQAHNDYNSDGIKERFIDVARHDSGALHMLDLRIQTSSDQGYSESYKYDEAGVVKEVFRGVYQIIEGASSSPYTFYEKVLFQTKLRRVLEKQYFFEIRDNKSSYRNLVFQYKEDGSGIETESYKVVKRLDTKSGYIRHYDENSVSSAYPVENGTIYFNTDIYKSYRLEQSSYQLFEQGKSALKSVSDVLSNWWESF